MKRIFSITFCFLFLLSTSFAQSYNPKLDSLLQKVGEAFLKNKPSSGLSIGIYNSGNTHFYNYGTSEIGKNSISTKNTIYEIGSITKTFISLILANAVLEKKVRLDDDIRKYLKGNYPNLEFNGSPIRLINLANTTSLIQDPLPDVPSNIKKLSADSAAVAKSNFYSKLSKKDLYEALHHVKLDTVPGFLPKHSNAAAQLLGFILEDIYNMPMAKLIKKYITDPYNMNNTFYLASAKNRQLAKGYNGKGELVPYEFSVPYFTISGGLGSTTSDLVSYLKMLLNNNNKAAALALKKTIDISATTNKVVKSRPENIPAADVYSASLGWFKYHPDVNTSQIWSDGGTSGFNSYIVIYPQMNSGIVLLANKSDEKTFRSLPGIANEVSNFMRKQLNK